MEFLTTIAEFFTSTNIPEQFRQVDAAGLFTNPWFLVPFVLFVGYQLYKQAINTLVITGVAIGLWIFSGSPLTRDLIVDGQLQLGKILPLAGVVVAALAIVVYFLFMRSE
ncbi:MAG: hypothetical protein ACOY8P_04375 [Thermodesulfobacteriota bacterium]